jgi:prevent-host-death family protein
LVKLVRVHANIVGLNDAKTHLSQLVDRAAAGEEIVIARNGIALAKPVPISRAAEQRKPARALGVTHMSPDFDAPLPPELQAAFEGKA